MNTQSNVKHTLKFKLKAIEHTYILHFIPTKALN